MLVRLTNQTNVTAEIGVFSGMTAMWVGIVARSESGVASNREDQFCPWKRVLPASLELMRFVNFVQSPPAGFTVNGYF